MSFATIDSTVALMSALFINGAILVVAAATFHGKGYHDIADISDAYQLLAPLLGATLASTLFAVALLFSGQNATMTGTLAGQIVMEGFLNIRMRPWLRRLITRLVAIIPALVTVVIYGDAAPAQLLILSQVILSLQLPFAVIPLIIFTSDKRRWAGWRRPRVHGRGVAGRHPDHGPQRVAPVGDVRAGFDRAVGGARASVYTHILVAIENSPADRDGARAHRGAGEAHRREAAAGARGRRLGGPALQGSPAPRVRGNQEDRAYLARVRGLLESNGLEVDATLRMGDPAKEICRVAEEEAVDLIAMATHGHRGVSDIIHGQTVDAVRHAARMPVLLLRRR